MSTEIIVTIVILSVISLISIFVNINSLRKIESQERVLRGYLIYLSEISKIIEISNQELNKVGAKGAFESDDEVGFFFKQLKDIQSLLNNFTLK